MNKTLDIAKTDTFDLKQTLDCGQVFRYTEDNGKFVLHAGCHRAEIEDRGNSYFLTADDADFFYKYLDFDTKYDIIQSKVQDKGLVSSAIEYGKGIHMLRQSPEETVFSFLISQNNHIPRIKGIISRICDGLGEDMGGWHAFPTVAALAGAGESYFSSIGAGYRAAYLARTAKALLKVDLNNWGKLSTADLRKELLSLHGVGRKVADCILLFGFGRFDVFPVDTWIAKIFGEEYPGLQPEKLSETLAAKYGGYSGYVQQWLFYYKRQKSIDKSKDLL